MKLAKGALRRPRWFAALFGALLVTGCVFASQAFAYSGEFCYGYDLSSANGYGCKSSTVKTIRRAIAHEQGYGYVALYKTGFDPALLDNYCYSDGCGQDTGYYSSDVDGFATYQEIAGGLKNGNAYGWLYP